MKIQATLLAFFVLFLASCSKETIAPEPTPEPEPVASAVVISYFHENTAYYQPYIYRYDEETKTWGKRIAAHFSTISTDDGTYLGFTNPYVEDSGVNLFQMVTLYSEYTGSTNIKTVGINADKVLQFFPDEESAMLTDAPTVRSKGTVNVFEQTIKMYKSVAETGTGIAFIEIGISGEGTYNLETGVIDLTVYFNETAIGGAEKVARQYKISKTALTL